jgi:uncharacterized membrane protein
MRGIYGFLRSTLLGGLVVLVPLLALTAVVVWAADLALRAITPVFEWLPDKSVGGVSLTVAAAILTLLGACFVAGLVAETTVIRALGDRAERFALFIPGYALMKNVGANLVGIEGRRPVKTVLVLMAVSHQIGFLMETLADGRLVIFIPGVPKALVGTLHIVPADRVQLLDMSVSNALDALSRLGVGMGECWPREPKVG